MVNRREVLLAILLLTLNLMGEIFLWFDSLNHSTIRIPAEPSTDSLVNDRVNE